jgi:serine protease Do
MRKSLLLSILFVVLAAVQASAQSSDFIASEVAAKVAPSICSVESLRVINTQLIMFGAGRQQAVLKEIGTGVIVDKSGYIICKNNLVEDSELVRITLNDGTQLDGDVIVNDRYYDIALIKINPKGHNLTPVKFGNPKSVVPGDSAICLGNSAGFKGTLTYGIISALRDYRTPNQVLVPNMIQADCAINAGNTGAPLFNWKGEMIGFHSNAGAVRGDRANINFFMPGDLIADLTREMIRTKERAKRPYLGVLPFGRIGRGYQELGDDLRMYFDLPEEYWDVGVLVQELDNDGAAMEFGLYRGDLIIEVEYSGQTVKLKSIGELEKMIQKWNIGQVVVFRVLRRNKILDVAVEIGYVPEDVEPFYI